MKNYLLYYLLITLSIIVNSCSEGFKEEYSKISIVLKEVTAITTPTTDTTPDYTFSSTESGANTYGGSCSSSTTIATTGNNTITLNTLSVGTYADCTITVSKTISTENSEKKLSGSLTMTSFTVTSSNDTTAPVIAEVTFVTTPDNDTTPDYTFSSSEAGTITYGGSCSSSTTSATADNNTITLASLTERTYSDCTIKVTDSAGNVSNTITLTSFIVDLTAATLIEVTAVTTPTDDNTPDYIFSSSEAGTITYGGSCSSSTTSATSGDNTITLATLSSGTYSDCTIKVTDSSGNESNTLTITSFTVVSGVFVAVGQSGTIIRSTDNGSSWGNATSPTGTRLEGVAFGNNTFVGVGYYGTIVRSTDNGSSFDNVTSGTGMLLSAVTFGNNTFVAVGGSGTQVNIVRSTDNGTTWDNVTSGTNEDLLGAGFANNTFVVVGKAGTILTSSDGSSWDNPTSGTVVDLDDVAFGNNTLAVSGSDATILRSTDNGTNWDDATTPGQIGVRRIWGIGFGNNTFVGTTHNGYIVRSTDNGSSFVYVTSTQVLLSKVCHLKSVSFGNNAFVLVCTGGDILRSTDNGETWDSVNSGTTKDLRGVVF
jgi:photosystem II stability/assembly factor-like uncharacterized protein